MNTGRILVVDDEETIRSLLDDYLVSQGYVVTTANDGEDALKKFIPGVFDCVITDLRQLKLSNLPITHQIW